MIMGDASLISYLASHICTDALCKRVNVKSKTRDTLVVLKVYFPILPNSSSLFLATGKCNALTAPLLSPNGWEPLLYDILWLLI